MANLKSFAAVLYEAGDDSDADLDAAAADAKFLRRRRTWGRLSVALLAKHYRQAGRSRPRHKRRHTLFGTVLLEYVSDAVPEAPSRWHRHIGAGLTEGEVLAAHRQPEYIRRWVLRQDVRKREREKRRLLATAHAAGNTADDDDDDDDGDSSEDTGEGESENNEIVEPADADGAAAQRRLSIRRALRFKLRMIGSMAAAALKRTFTLQRVNETSEYHMPRTRDLFEVLKDEYDPDRLAHPANEFYTPKALLQRESLRWDRGVRACLDSIWSVADADQSHGVDKSEYYTMHAKMSTAMLGEKVSARAEFDLANVDWELDRQGAHYMNYTRFINSFFTLADRFTMDCEGASYSGFLDALHNALIEKGADGKLHWRDDDSLLVQIQKRPLDSVKVLKKRRTKSGGRRRRSKGRPTTPGARPRSASPTTAGGGSPDRLSPTSAPTSKAAWGPGNEGEEGGGGGRTFRAARDGALAELSASDATLTSMLKTGTFVVAASPRKKKKGKPASAAAPPSSPEQPTPGRVVDSPTPQDSASGNPSAGVSVLVVGPPVGPSPRSPFSPAVLPSPGNDASDMPRSRAPVALPVRAAIGPRTPSGEEILDAHRRRSGAAGLAATPPPRALAMPWSPSRPSTATEAFRSPSLSPVAHRTTMSPVALSGSFSPYGGTPLRFPRDMQAKAVVTSPERLQRSRTAPSPMSPPRRKRTAQSPMSPPPPRRQAQSVPSTGDAQAATASSAVDDGSPSSPRRGSPRPSRPTGSATARRRKREKPQKKMKPAGAPMPAALSGVAKQVALFDFVAYDDGMLTVKKGERLLEIPDRDGAPEPGWILVARLGQLDEVGYVPKAYVLAVGEVDPASWRSDGSVLAGGGGESDEPSVDDGGEDEDGDDDGDDAGAPSGDGDSEEEQKEVAAARRARRPRPATAGNNGRRRFPVRRSNVRFPGTPSARASRPNTVGSGGTAAYGYVLAHTQAQSLRELSPHVVGSIGGYAEREGLRPPPSTDRGTPLEFFAAPPPPRCFCIPARGEAREAGLCSYWRYGAKLAREFEVRMLLFGGGE